MTVFIDQWASELEQVYSLAHEFGHSWQLLHCPQTFHHEPYFDEGFAEWIAFHTLDFVGAIKIKGFLTDVIRYKDKINLPEKLKPYFEGLAFFLKLEKKYGKQHILRLMMDGYYFKRPPKAKESK